MYQFADRPTSTEFNHLAAHLTDAQQTTLHPELWPQRTLVAERLRQMAEQPEQQEHLSAYHALRLFVW